MTHRLLIRIAALPDSATWALLDASWKPVQSGVGLATVPASGSYSAVDVLVPGQRLICTSVQVPAKQRSQLQLAVPYALEDQLASDVEHMHFALGPETIDGKVDVAAVDRADMKGWIEALRLANIDPLRVIPEPLVLPQGSVILESSQATVRLGDLASTVEPDLLEVLFKQAGLSASEVEVTDFSAEDHDRFFGFVGAQLKQSDPINLLQGSFARHSALESWWRQWRTSVALAAVLVIGILATQAVQVWQLGQARDSVVEQSQLELNSVFPDAPATGDPRGQLRQSLAALRASKGLGNEGGFLALLREVGPGIAQDTSVQLEEVQFRNEQLEVQLKFTSVEALDRFRNRLQSNAGLGVEVLSATTGVDGVSGRLRVTSRGRTS